MFNKPIVREKRQIIKTKVQQENDTREISSIGETETSSPATSCAEITVTADR